MPRYIDAEAFDADCRKRYCTDCGNYNGVKCRACWVDDMLGDVEDAPTVSPDDVRGVGEWITKEKGKVWWYECSCCGTRPLKSRWANEETLSCYCPSCGARMKGAEDGTTDNP